MPEATQPLQVNLPQAPVGGDATLRQIIGLLRYYADADPSIVAPRAVPVPIGGNDSAVAYGWVQAQLFLVTHVLTQHLGAAVMDMPLRDLDDLIGQAYAGTAA